jgi:hypothetical protein
MLQVKGNPHKDYDITGPHPDLSVIGYCAVVRRIYRAALVCETVYIYHTYNNMASGEKETHPENWSVEGVVEFIKRLPDFSDFAPAFESI